MTTKIFFLITLLAYAVVVSQSFMYMLSLKQVQCSLDVISFTEIRKLTDNAMRASFKYVIYAALLANVLLVLTTAGTPGSLYFISAAIGLLALVIDVLLTVKGSLPINDVINTWSADHYPANWAYFRDKWFTIFQYRQMANIAGFLSLLLGAIFGNR